MVKTSCLGVSIPKSAVLFTLFGCVLITMYPRRTSMMNLKCCTNLWLLKLVYFTSPSWKTVSMHRLFWYAEQKFEGALDCL